MNSFLKTALVGALSLSVLPAIQAASVSIPITDVGTWGGYTTDTSPTFSTTGFFGEYGGQNDSELAHLFGVEPNLSRVVAQADIGFLNGASIVSATLTFNLNDGFAGAHNVELTGFSSGGTLGYLWDAPEPYLQQQTFTAQGLSANSFDITALVQEAATADVDWLGLHLAGADDGQYEWSYTFTNLGAGPDSANVRLNIEYNEEAPVPEVQTYATMLGAALIGARALRRRFARA
jgi:hypothetical protein